MHLRTHLRPITSSNKSIHDSNKFIEGPAKSTKFTGLRSFHLVILERYYSTCTNCGHLKALAQLWFLLDGESMLR